MVHGRSISVNVLGVACPIRTVKTRLGKTLNESKWNLEYLIHHVGWDVRRSEWLYITNMSNGQRNTSSLDQAVSEDAYADEVHAALRPASKGADAGLAVTLVKKSLSRATTHIMSVTHNAILDIDYF